MHNYNNYPYSEFTDYIQSLSIPLPNKQIETGKFTRWGKKGRYYAILFADGHGGIIGDWKSDFRETWLSDRFRKLPSDEQGECRRKHEECNKRVQEEQERIHVKSAKVAQMRFEKANIADPGHAYLCKKEIRPFGVKQEGDKLLIPMRDIEGKIWSLQTIGTQGNKRFMAQAKKRGLFYVLGDVSASDKYLVCEGYATGASLRMAINMEFGKETEGRGIATVIAFDAYNMEPVIDSLKNRYPQKQCILCADDDITKRDHPLCDHPLCENIGRKIAETIQEQHNIAVVFPQFNGIGNFSTVDNVTVDNVTDDNVSSVSTSQDHPLCDHPLCELSDFNDLHVRLGLEEVQAQIAVALSNIRESHGETGRLEAEKDLEMLNVEFLRKSHEIPSFPEHLLPETIQKIAREHSNNINAPIDFLMIPILSVVSMAIGSQVRPCTKSGWSEPVIMWFVMNGLPSSGKSPALSLIFSNIATLEMQYNEEYREQYKEYLEQLEKAEIAKKIWQAKCKEAYSQGSIVPNKPNEAKEPLPPKKKRLTVENATIEKILDLNISNPHGLLSINDELAGFFKSMGQYKRQEGNDRSVYLSAYNGLSYQYDRMRQGEYDTSMIPCLALGVIGCIQPDVLRNLLLSKEADDGMFSRFCISSPASIDFTAPKERADDGFFHIMIERIINEIRPVYEGVESLKYIHLSDDADSMLNNYRKLMKGKEGNSEGLMIGYIGKNAGKALRLSLIFEVMEAVFNWHSRSWHSRSWHSRSSKNAHISHDIWQPIEINSISGQSMSKAIALLDDYFDPMAEYSLGTLAKSPVIRDVAKIAIYILKHKPEIVNIREVGRKNILGRNAETLVYDRAFEHLEVHGILFPVVQNKSATSGRKRRDFTVNPNFYTSITIEEIIL